MSVFPGTRVSVGLDEGAAVADERRSSLIFKTAYELGMI